MYTKCKSCPCCDYVRLDSTKMPAIKQKDIMVIGDCPTAVEAARNSLMTGTAVDVLKRAMAQVGLPTDTNTVHYTTAIKCAAPKRKGKPFPKEPMRQCSENIRREITQVNPKLVLVLGKNAYTTLTGDFNVKITEKYGRAEKLDYTGDAIIMPVMHPALIMRAPNDYKPFLASLQLAKQHYGGSGTHDTGTTTWTVLDTDTKIDKALEFLGGLPAQYVAADIETTGLDYRTAEFTTMGICYAKNKALIIPRATRHRIQEFFDLKNLKWIWHNGMFDSKILWARNLGEMPHHEDTMYLHYMLDETSAHDLGSLTKTFLQAEEYKYKMNQEFKAVTLETYDHYYEALNERAAVDVDYTYQLFEVLHAELSKPQNRGLYICYYKLLMPAAAFLSRVMRHGIELDVEYLKAMDVEYQQRLSEILGNIERLAAPYWKPEIYMEDMGAKTAPEKFNPGSSKQMQWMVYKALKCKPRIRKGMSTGADILKSIDEDIPLIKEVLNYRKVKKEHSTYVIGLLNQVADDGRIRTNFSLHTTATGRLSSKEPNFQNIPSYFGVGNVRRAFRAKKGHVLMEVDYSGAELRVLACLSKCPTLTGIFVNRLNLHDETSRMVFGENFTKQDRMRAKALNFGVMYGRGAASLKDEFNIPLEEAQVMVDNWLNSYPGAKQYLMWCSDMVVAGKYLETPFGRRRRFGLVTPESLHALQNESRNFAIQSTSSDFLLYSAMEMEQVLWDKYQTRIVNLIHDSVLLEIPAKPEIIQAVSLEMSSKMKGMPKQLFGYEVPFESDSDLGVTWGDLSGYDNETNMVGDKTLVEWMKENNLPVQE